MISRRDYESAYERLRQKLRTSRKESSLTQAEVARILGKPQSFISKMEIGERRVDFLELQLLAHIYGRSATDFEDETFTRRVNKAHR